MRRQIPFLDLADFPADLKLELQAKFSQMLDKGIFSGGEEVVGLENELKAYLKAPYFIACSNGTDALEIALRALNLGQGDEVIVPAMTWVSTAEAVQLVAATPVFAEIDANGLLDLDKLPKYLSPKTKAIIPVHLYGKMVNMKKLSALAKANNLYLIEDAAQAFGACQHGIPAGLWGDIGCFSFYPTKNLGALGEAGGLSTKDSSMDRKIRLLINHGQEVRDTHEIVGRNARIDTLQAGFLRVKLNHFDHWQRNRKALAKQYLGKLSKLTNIQVPAGILEEDHNAHLFVIQTPERDNLKLHLQSRGIGTAIHYPNPIPLMPVYSNQPGAFPIAEKFSHTILSLPLHPFLSEEDVKYICSEIIAFFDKGSS